MKTSKDIIEIAGLTAYSLDFLSKKLNVSKNTLRLKIKSGEIKGKKLAGTWYVTESNIKAYLEPEK
jgi:hypothetical protein